MRASRTMRAKRAQAKHRRPRSFQLESLEPRQVMAACVGIDDLATVVDNELIEAKNQAADFWLENSLPLIGKKLVDSVGPLDMIRDELPGVVQQLQSVLEDVNGTGTHQEIGEHLEDSLNDQLNAAGYGVGTVNVTCDDNSLNVAVDLSRTVDLSVGFDIGIAPLPIFSLSSEGQLDVQLKLDGLQLNFGIDAETGAFFDVPDGISLTASADFTGDVFEATVGLLAGSISIEREYRKSPHCI